MTLSTPQAPTSDGLSAYLTGTQARWFWITIGITIATLAAVFLIPENLAPWVYIRYVMGSFYVLWFPGYTFIRTLFPVAEVTEQEEKNLSLIERAALSVGMSVALVPLTLFVLNYTPWGILLTPIMLTILALTVIFSSTALLREYNLNRRMER